jgi:hypothetical protein
MIVLVMTLLPLLVLLLFMMTPLEFEVIVGDAEFCVTTNDVPGIGADCPVWLCEACC